MEIDKEPVEMRAVLEGLPSSIEVSTPITIQTKLVQATDNIPSYVIVADGNVVNNVPVCRPADPQTEEPNIMQIGEMEPEHQKRYQKSINQRILMDKFPDTSDAELAQEQQEILQFMERHAPEGNIKKDVNVKDLRRMIPLLIITVYNKREDKTQRKFKGLWTDVPSDWPPDVPYLDPNNTLKGEEGKGKPKKDILMQMFRILSRKYYSLKKKGFYQNGVAPVEHPAVESSMEFQNVPSTLQKLTAVVQPTPVCEEDSQELDSDDSKEEETIMWNPAEELKDRIDGKLESLASQGFLPVPDLSSLKIIQDLLTKMFDVRDQGLAFYLQRGHEFEADLDLIQITRKLDDIVHQKWKDFEVSDKGIFTQEEYLKEETVGEVPSPDMGQRHIQGYKLFKQIPPVCSPPSPERNGIQQIDPGSHSLHTSAIDDTDIGANEDVLIDLNQVYLNQGVLHDLNQVYLNEDELHDLNQDYFEAFIPPPARGLLHEINYCQTSSDEPEEKIPKLTYTELLPPAKDNRSLTGMLQSLEVDDQGSSKQNDGEVERFACAFIEKKVQKLASEQGYPVTKEQRKGIVENELKQKADIENQIPTVVEEKSLKAIKIKGRKRKYPKLPP